MMMIGPRVYARMADDGLFPRQLGRFSEVPGRAIALQAGLAILLVWVSGLKELLEYAGFTLGLSAAATVVGLIVLRIKEGPERVPVPGFPWLPLAFVVPTLGAAGFLVAQPPRPGQIPAWVAGISTVAAGLPVYWILRRVYPQGGKTNVASGEADS